MISKISIPAVLTSAAARFVIGAIWTPLLFADRWMEYTGWTHAQEQAAQENIAVTFTVAFASYLVQAFVLALLIQRTNTTKPLGGATVGFLAWIGFASVILLQDSLFELRPLGLFAIKAGYELVSLMTMGIILAVWKKPSTSTA